MLGRTFTPSYRTQTAPWRVAVLVSIGPVPFVVALSSDRAGCAALASAMLGIPEDDLDLAMIDDVMRELANMTAGQIKRELANEHLLGLPTMQDGDALMSPAANWSHHVLMSDAIQLVVSLTSTIL
jgi:CheY-specific phosphatase CheX